MNANSHIRVEVGDKVDSDSVLAEVRQSQEEKTLHLGRLLHVGPSDIAKFLKKSIGEKIESGEVIAEKKGWLSNTFVTTPVAGQIKEIDLEKGTLTVSSSHSIKSSKIISPYSGKVLKIGKGYIELEIEADSVKGHGGTGAEVAGIVAVLPGENIGTLDLHLDVEGKIIVCHSFTEDFAVKLDVLGAHGVVVHKAVKDMTLPWLQVDEAALSKLKEYDGRKALLRPEEKEIVIFNG